MLGGGTDLDLTLDEKILMCKPVRHVGMGIDDPVFNAPIAFKTSEQLTLLLTKAIKTGQGVNLTDYGYQASNKYLSKES